MPKPDDIKPKPKPDEKAEKNKAKIKNAKKHEVVQISANGTITAGTWVAEMDTVNIRKNTLRRKVI